MQAQQGVDVIVKIFAALIQLAELEGQFLGRGLIGGKAVAHFFFMVTARATIWARRASTSLRSRRNAASDRCNQIIIGTATHHHSINNALTVISTRIRYQTWSACSNSGIHTDKVGQRRDMLARMRASSVASRFFSCQRRVEHSGDKPL